MANEIVKANEFFKQEQVKAKFEELLGKRASAFMTSVLQIVNNNEMLKKADPFSVFNAARMAATMDLPINSNLGFAYIVPYNVKQQDGSYKVEAQFQVGYRGFIQLALRSGQFLNISCAPVYEGQLLENDPLLGCRFNWKEKKSEVIVGYVAFFKLVNGFEKHHYMTVEELTRHGMRFSQTFKKGFGLWKTDFESMASKTVLKLLLAKYAPLSIEMQLAVNTDQGIVKVDDQVEYPDNEEEVVVDKQAERVLLMIQDARTTEELEQMRELAHSSDNLIKAWNEREEQLTLEEAKRKDEEDKKTKAKKS